MRLLHSLASTHASFDDPNLGARTGLVPVMPGGPCGVNADLKIPCLVVGVAAGRTASMLEVADAAFQLPGPARPQACRTAGRNIESCFF